MYTMLIWSASLRGGKGDWMAVELPLCRTRRDAVLQAFRDLGRAEDVTWIGW